MKVRCITNENLSPGCPSDNCPEPEVGDILTVVNERTFNGVPCYKFSEFLRYWYDQKNFAPVDGPDETARLEAWQESQMTEADRLLQLCAEMMPEEEMPAEATARVWQGIQKHLEDRR